MSSRPRRAATAGAGAAAGPDAGHARGPSPGTTMGGMTDAIPPAFWLGPAGALLALGGAAWLHRWMLAADPGTPRMRRIAGYVREGAMAFLRQQYRVVAWFFLALFTVLC